MAARRGLDASLFAADEDAGRLERAVRSAAALALIAPPAFVAVIAVVSPATFLSACWGLLAPPVVAVTHALLRARRVRAVLDAPGANAAHGLQPAGAAPTVSAS